MAALQGHGEAHAAIYDSDRHEMVVFGGYAGGVWDNHVSALSLGATPTWRAITPAGTPPVGRNSMSAIYDVPRQRMVVFGGWTGTAYSDEVWTLNLAGSPQWTKVTSSGRSPSARRHYQVRV